MELQDSAGDAILFGSIHPTPRSNRADRAEPGLARTQHEDRHDMAIRIKSRGGESVEQLMRRFKKLCEKEGLTKDVKKRAFYEKPSERKRRARRRVARPSTGR